MGGRGGREGEEGDVRVNVSVHNTFPGKKRRSSTFNLGPSFALIVLQLCTESLGPRERRELRQNILSSLLDFKIGEDAF